MARYQRPPDPRKHGWREDQAKPGEIQSPGRGPFPWLWLGLGLIVSILGIGLAAALISFVLDREPLAISLPTPTIIRLAAPPSPIPTGVGSLPTTTPLPTFTPPPTPDLSIAPNEITVGFFALVANTDGIGVSLRGGPSTDNVRILLIPEGSFLLVIGGPAEGNGFVWWQVQAEDGQQGWVAGDFIEPASAPGEDEQIGDS